MNWDAIGAVGEILGALAVVGSLVYLAFQIKISNRAARQAAIREVQDLNSDFLSTINSSTENCRIWVKGCFNDVDLSVYEKFQYRSFLNHMNSQQERFYRSHENGELEEWIWVSSIGPWRRVWTSPGYQAWFKDIKHSFNPDWREYIETELDSLAGPYKPQGLDISAKRVDGANGT